MYFEQGTIPYLNQSKGFLELACNKILKLKDPMIVVDYVGNIFSMLLKAAGNLKRFDLVFTAGSIAEARFNDVKNTISLHRKKHSNTLYTINALNELIMDINNGILDTSYQVPWDIYKNMILISNKEGLSKIPTRILKIINI